MNFFVRLLMIYINKKYHKEYFFLLMHYKRYANRCIKKPNKPRNAFKIGLVLKMLSNEEEHLKKILNNMPLLVVYISYIKL